MFNAPQDTINTLNTSVNTNTTSVQAVLKFAEFNETSRPRDGERLIKVCYRTDSKTKTKPRESVCISIPPITETSIKENIDKFLPLFIASIQEQQDKIARKLYEAGNSSITTNELGLDAIAEFLEESVYESRLTKELIDTWFDVLVADKLSSVILAKSEGKGITEEKLTAILTEYKSKFSALAGGRTSYESSIALALLKVFDLLDSAEDTLTIRLYNRLGDMLRKQKKVEEALFVL